MARHGKRRADMGFRVSTAGPVAIRALEWVVMDHTLSDIVVVDDNSMLPLGRPTLTTALDEHTRCPMGFFTGFEPPSCLPVMRRLKHAVLLCPARVSVDQESLGMLRSAGTRGGR